MRQFWWVSKEILFCFLCVEVLRPSQPHGVMSSTVSLPNHTFTGQARSSKWLTLILHILSLETDNCPSWISGRERIIVENTSWLNLQERMLMTQWGSNPQHPDHQSGRKSNWATEAGYVLLEKSRQLILRIFPYPDLCFQSYRNKT